MKLVALAVGTFVIVVLLALWWLRRPQKPELLEMPDSPLPPPGNTQNTKPAVSENDLLGTLAGSTSNAMYDLVIKNGDLHWNDTFYTIFGYDPKEPAETIEWWATHIHPDDALQVNDAMDKLLDSSINDWVINYRFRKGDGTYVLVSDRSQVHRDNHGQPMRVFGTLTIQNQTGTLQMPTAPQT